MSAEPLTVSLARRACGFSGQRLDEATVRAARTAIIDTVAVTLLGSCEPSARIARSTLAGAARDGAASLFGTCERASALDAAFANGVAAHALDFDDFTQAFGGHPSVPVLPALFALAEARDLSGRELLAAYVVGVEVETRIAHGVHFHHYDKGWHPTSTLGVFGAAAGCAHVLGLDEHRMATALAIAASLASGVKANFGSMTKPLHVGHCTRSGLHAALLAAQGFDAKLDALEHPQGFLELYNGHGHYDVSAMLGRWFEPPLVLRPGIGIKQFACCGSTHPAIYMALDLRDRQGVRAQDIARVRVLTHARRLPHTDNPDPRTPLEAKFSLQYCVARSLLDGPPRLRHFCAPAPEQAAVRRLMAVTEVGVHPQMGERRDRTFGAEVIVTLRDGVERRARVEHMPGRGADNPLSAAELEAKFTDCAGAALTDEAVARLWRTLLGLDTLGSVRELARIMHRGAKRGRAAG